MKLDIEHSAQIGTRWLMLAAAVVAFAIPSVALAEEQPAKPAPAAPAQGSAADMDGQPVVNITPTAGVWRDKLRDARRRVLDATARLDEVNAAYAKALYEHADDEKVIASFAAKRTSAQQQVDEARAAIPPMVEAARADGVSQRVLDLYEQATLKR